MSVWSNYPPSSRSRALSIVAAGILVCAACGCDETTSPRGDTGVAVDARAAGDARATADSGGPAVQKTVSYVEPTAMEGAAVCSTNGGPLSDLDHTTIYYKVNDGPGVTAATVPATSPTGGGTVSRQITITGLSAASQVTIWVTATNKAMIESDPTCSEQVTLMLP